MNRYLAELPRAASRVLLAVSCLVFSLFSLPAAAELPQRLSVSDASVGRTLAAGQHHACALTPGGEVLCWGRNDEGQLGRGTGTQFQVAPAAIVGLDRVISITAGGQHTCALREDGSVWCWGANADGQAGDGTTLPRLVPGQVAGLHGVRQITAGARHTCALTADGDIYCWGANDQGQLGINATVPRWTAPALAMSSARGVYSGSTANHTCAIDSLGYGYCWGSNSKGQLGLGSAGGVERAPQLVTASCLDPDDSTSNDCDFTSLSLGAEFTCSVSARGTWTHCWGDNSDGQYVLSQSQYNSPQALTTSLGELVLGARHMCIMWEGSLACYGDDSSGQANNTAYEQVETSAAITGAEFSCGLKANGQLYCWGDNAYGQLGVPSYCSGKFCLDQSGPNVAVNLGALIAANSTPHVSVDDNHACQKRADGSVTCWGYNGYGHLGDGTTTQRTQPVGVSGLGEVAQVAVGTYHSCALKPNGTVWCWGRNTYGEIGTGTTGSNQTTPQQVSGVSNAVQLSLGKYHTCARTVENDVYCWGLNDGGQAGSSNFANQPSPVLNAQKYRAIGLGQFHSCGVDDRGRLWCWGRGASMQLGTSGGATRVRVPSLAASVTEVQATWLNTCALTGDGELYCWGRNAEQQLGRSGADATSPENIPNLDEVTAFAVGVQSICAQSASEDRPHCWGANNELQLGWNSTARNLISPTPTLISADTNTRNIAGRGKGFCTVGTYGELRCWGNNGNGQLGTGSTADAPAATTALDSLCSPGEANPDGNPCSIDTCVMTSSGPSDTDADSWNEAACDDGTTCNGVDRCSDGVCVADATLYQTNQGCTAAACANDVLTWADRASGYSCNDGNACTHSDVCDGSGTCSGAGLPLDDGNPCTVDSCSPTGGVIHTAVTDDTPCPDSDACNGAEVCSSGACVAGPLPSFDDDNPCTVDACDAVAGVTHTPLAEGTSCSDGNLCNGAETCDAVGACQAGSNRSRTKSRSCRGGQERRMRLAA